MNEIISETLPVDAKRLQKFNEVLQKYKAGKSKLDRRVIAAEQWWKLRNSDEAIKAGLVEPDASFKAKSGWLHNVIVAKHADAMDNYPEPIILPREQNDEEQAKTLSAVLPVVLEQTGFKRTYWDAWWQKLKTGTGVYKVIWDQSKNNGRGDIAIERVNLLHIFWEPGISDIQKSRYFFHCELVDNEVLEDEYPQLKGKLSGATFTLAKFLYDDNVDTTEKSVVVDVYYKKGGVLHFCKYVNDQVLASTENEGGTGLYDHGKYPFVFDALWPIEGSPCGYGFVDLCANPQMYLDMMDTSFLKNTMVGATPRYFSRTDGAVNEDEFLDLRKPLVHVNGATLDDNSLRVIDYKPLSGTYMSVYNGKIMELRETSGNTETANGATPSGVTAASAIAALQEASGKTSRDSTQASYMSFADIIDLCVELIRQFYDMPRTFRITGDQGQQQFTAIDNAAMKPQPMWVGDVDLGYRLPVYDIRVEVQKRNAYTRTAQNELALQFFQLGFFAPEMATPALACIDMMDFDGKEELMQKLSMNGTLQQKLMETQQIALSLAQQVDPALAAQLAASMGIEGTPMPAGEPVDVPNPEQESPITAKARARTAATTEVNG